MGVADMEEGGGIMLQMPRHSVIAIVHRSFPAPYELM